MAARRIYRIVLTGPPTIVGFRSHAERGIPLRRPTPELRRVSTGVSLRADLASARRNLRRLPMLGQFIAAIELDPATVPIEPTTPDPAHNTIRPDAAMLLKAVVAIMPEHEQDASG